MRTRVKGRAAIVRSLRLLHRRVYRFATLRACTPEDYKWALRLSGALHALIVVGDPNSSSREHTDACAEPDHVRDIR